VFPDVRQINAEGRSKTISIILAATLAESSAWVSDKTTCIAKKLKSPNYLIISNLDFICSGNRTRTCDLWVMSPTSCQLLHPAILCYKSTNKFHEFNTFVVMNEQKIISDPHKAGFVAIVGKPNVGKSTLMNALVGERLSIITSKAQTTRHRILGIMNGEHKGTEFQLIYSDTPGIIKPAYELHKSMMRFVNGSLEDADIVLFVTDIYEKHDEDDVIQKLRHHESPMVILINKIDQASPLEVEEKVAYWHEVFPACEILPISALEKTNLLLLFDKIVSLLPVHPPYFPKDDLTDKPERFFAAEMVREKIFLNYKKEVPYSSEVVISEFVEKEGVIVIRAEIYVERASQRAILLGHQGEKIKKLGIDARKELEAFFQKKVFLETYVKVEPNWRNEAKRLDQFGYNDQ
jgi:GTPase